MKLYAKTTSERASKGQGGNEYLETLYHITDATTPQARVRVINDDPMMGLIYFSVEEYHFGAWRVVYNQTYYTNVSETETKGKK